MEDVHAGLGLQNMSDPVLKEIYDIYETKNLTKDQIKKYKMTEREIFKRFDNLSKDELNIKKRKAFMLEMMLWLLLLKLLRVKEKRSKKNRCLKKKN